MSSALHAAKRILIEDGFSPGEAEQWLAADRMTLLYRWRALRSAELCSNDLIETPRTLVARRMISALLAISSERSGCLVG